MVDVIEDYMIEFTWMNVIYHVFRTKDNRHIIQVGIDPLGEVRYHDVFVIRDTYKWLY